MINDRVRRAWRRWRAFLDNVRELEERRLLLDRPWEERFLHWAWHEDGWRLHGFRVPPRAGMSVTRRGWCPRVRPEKGGAGAPGLRASAGRG